MIIRLIRIIWLVGLLAGGGISIGAMLGQLIGQVLVFLIEGGVISAHGWLPLTMTMIVLGLIGAPLGCLVLACWAIGDDWIMRWRSPRGDCQVLLLLVAIGFLVGCATTTSAPVPLVAEAPASAPPEVVAEPTPTPTPPPFVSPHEAMSALSQAYQQAIIRPRASDFRGIVAHLPDYPHALYALNLGYRQPLTILLPPGEVAEPVITDDWWNVINTTSGEGATRRSVIVIQALNDQPQTSYTSIVTNKTVRFLELHSLAKGRSLRAVTWEPREPPKPKVYAWPAGVYHTDYQIEPKDGGPAWKPLQVWTLPAEQKTVILWPEAKLQGKAPVIYFLGPDGEQRQVVNRRSKGRYTEIDEYLFAAAELRVGHDPKNSEVVFIKGPAQRSVRCPGPDCPVPPTQGVR